MWKEIKPHLTQPGIEGTEDAIDRFTPQNIIHFISGHKDKILTPRDVFCAINPTQQPVSGSLLYGRFKAARLLAQNNETSRLYLIENWNAYVLTNRLLAQEDYVLQVGEVLEENVKPEVLPLWEYAKTAKQVGEYTLSLPFTEDQFALLATLIQHCPFPVDYDQLWQSMYGEQEQMLVNGDKDLYQHNVKALQSTKKRAQSVITAIFQDKYKIEAFSNHQSYALSVELEYD